MTAPTPRPPRCFDLMAPNVPTIPLLADSPHSGSVMPPDFDFVCARGDLRQSEDSYVDRFALTVPEKGGVLLRALVNRAYIDLNRSLSDLHPDLCDAPIPWPIHRSKRVQYGMGLIRNLVRPNEPVYDRLLTLDEIEHRIAHYYVPYYDTLEQQLNGLRDRFERVLHINLHAMPYLGFDGSPLADIVLGDHDGHSCARVYREMIKRYFESCGLKVTVNTPYKGVELTRRFAKPRQGIHAIQIEINKALYMDETTLAMTDDMPQMMRIMNGLWESLAEQLQPDRDTIPQAAE